AHRGPARRCAARPRRLRRRHVERRLRAHRTVGGRAEPADRFSRFHPRPLADDAAVRDSDAATRGLADVGPGFVMRLLLTLGLLLLGVAVPSAVQSAADGSTVSIVPQPGSLVRHPGAFVLTPRTAIDA